MDWSLVPADGPRFENLVASHLLKWVHYQQDVFGKDLDLRYFRDTDGREVDFDFEVDGEAHNVKVEGFVKVSDEQAYLTCGLQGLGLIQPARIAAQPYLDSGLLREVLPQWKPVPMPVSVADMKNRRVSPRVRAFVDWLAELFEKTEHVDQDLSRVRQLLRGLHPA